MCVCVCVCVYTYVCIYVCMYTRMYVCIYIHTQAGKEGLAAAVAELFGSDASWEAAVNTLGAQFTCFTSTKVQILTQKGGGHSRIPACGARASALQG